MAELKHAGKPASALLICRTLGVPRSSLYSARLPLPSVGPGKRGPRTQTSDEALLSSIKEVLDASPFSGEGYRKVRARLSREKGISASGKRVLRLMRENGLLAPVRSGPKNGDPAHAGTIIPETPDELWGTDATRVETTHEGWGWVFVCIDHWSAEAWADVVKRGDRFAAGEPVRMAVRERFGALGADAARGIALRHDHGPQYTSDHFQSELKWLGITSSPAYVGEPEGNGCAERFIRTLKEQCLWVQRFSTIEEARVAVRDFVDRYNREWLIERHGHRSPREAYRDFHSGLKAA